MGTPDYSSPEQLEGIKAIDGRADIYSLGCVLYHCLAGQPPFVRESEVRVITAHLHDPPPELSQLRPDLPARLTQILDKAMAKERADRYATASDFADALAEVLAELEGDSDWDTTPLLREVDREAAESASPSSKGKTVLDHVAGQLPLKPRAEALPGRLVLGGRKARELLANAKTRGGHIRRLDRHALGVLWRSRGGKVLVVGALVVVGAVVAAISLATGNKQATGPSTSGALALPQRVADVTASDKNRGVGYNGEAKLSFAVPASGQLPVTKVEWRAVSTHGRARSGLFKSPATGSAKQSKISALAAGLSNGVAYSFIVRACNDEGCAAWSRTSNTVTPFGRPLPPTVSARATGTTIVFGWVGGGKKGRPVARYQISINGGPWQNVGARAGHVARRYGYGSRHGIRARLVDSAGQVSNTSPTASATTTPAPRTRPSPVQPPPTQTAVNQ